MDMRHDIRPIDECEQIIIYIIITLMTVVVNATAAIATFARAKFVVDNLGQVNLPESSIPVFAALQAAGALGLLLGLLGVPLVGVAAASGLVLFFIVAAIVHLRARDYRSLPSPVLFLVLATATLVLTVFR